METDRRRARFGGILLALLAVIATGACQAEPVVWPDSLEIWHEALSEAGDRPVRVVVVSDSMGELSHGYEKVWAAFHQATTGAPRGAWHPPRRMNGASGWRLLAGEPAVIGLEGRGQLLRQGDGPAGLTSQVVVPTTLDVYYTARPDGAPLDVRVDGATIATIDTSLDERGIPVEAPRVAQRWRSSTIGTTATWQVEATGPGVAAVESVSTPPSSGIEVHGTGQAGASTQDVLERGHALGHIEAMVARGEPPDLVVWGADTADSNDLGAQASALVLALDETRRIVPTAAIAHYIPTGHNGRDDWETWADAYRSLDATRGAIVLDGHAALGDVSRGAPNAHLGLDGVHLTPAGQALMDQAWIDALLPPWLQTHLPTTSWHRALAAADERPVRVVVLSDAVGARSGGFGGVWQHFHEGATGAPPGAWRSPRPGDGASGWDLLPGEPAAIGVDGSGMLLRAQDGPAGMAGPAEVPTTLDVYYTARPDGALLDLRFDGTTVATIDTSLDELGDAVTAPKASQRWRSSPVSGTVTWQLAARGSGVAALEAVSTPPAAGIEVHGTGWADVSTRQLLDGGQALGHIEAMVARGEAPDLVVWAADTDPGADLIAEVTATSEALSLTRHAVPRASVVHYVPPGHGGRADWPSWVPWYLTVATNHQAISVDGFAALGDISVGAPGAHLGVDGTNLSPEGQAVLDQAFIAALAPPAP